VIAEVEFVFNDSAAGEPRDAMPQLPCLGRLDPRKPHRIPSSLSAISRAPFSCILGSTWLQTVHPVAGIPLRPSLAAARM
jgi:hypothetical protein